MDPAVVAAIVAVIDDEEEAEQEEMMMMVAQIAAAELIELEEGGLGVYFQPVYLNLKVSCHLTVILFHCNFFFVFRQRWCCIVGENYC